ncbi:MAG: TldD/PmbA family protein [Candidatus Aminicenantes bacterium]|nr:TldD/PmbA family protein [Candidatus Aminicenantes bacterium]
MKSKKDSKDFQALAENLVEYGRKNGADEIEVSAYEGSEFSVDIRLGQVENLVEAGSCGLSFRIIKDQKTAFATSSDLTETTLHRLAKNAIERAELANSDEFAGLPELKKMESDIVSLKLYDPNISSLESKKKIDLALETERIALKNPSITNSHGSSFETREVQTILANSKGFSKGYKETFFSLGVGLQGGETDEKVEDYWGSSSRFFNELDSPEEIAKHAVERTLRQLNSKKIKTQNIPVIFEPLMTSWLLGFLFSCIAGTSVYQKTTFLSDKLGKKIGNENISVVDDGLIPGKLGTNPFDSEGVPTQRTQVIDKGVLKNFLCDTYSARKLNLKTTGNSEGNSVGPNNFYLEPGRSTPHEIIASLDKGLILIRTIGHGLNPVTGDISRGAFGLWVEKGEIVYPVSEITISGNLGTVLNSVEEIGSDLEFRRAVTGPTIKIAEMTVAGE